MQGEFLKSRPLNAQHSLIDQIVSQFISDLEPYILVCERLFSYLQPLYPVQTTLMQDGQYTDRVVLVCDTSTPLKSINTNPYQPIPHNFYGIIKTGFALARLYGERGLQQLRHMRYCNQTVKGDSQTKALYLNRIRISIN